MELLNFKTYQQYVEAQRKTLRRRGSGPYFTDLEMDRIQAWLLLRGKRVDDGLCHGVRDGVEVQEFRRVFPTAVFIGTDMFPHSGKLGRDEDFRKKNPVKKWDFSQVLKEWVGAFDLVYTNSLDHARDPVQTLGVWLEQLKQDGYLFISWNGAGTRAHGGDCFASSLYERIELANYVGVLHDLLYVNANHIPKQINKRKWKTRRKGRESVLLVIGKKPTLIG